MADEKQAQERKAALEPVMLVMLMLGVACLTLGAGMAYAPAGFLTAGAFFVLIPLAWARGGWAS